MRRISLSKDGLYAEYTFESLIYCISDVSGAKNISFLYISYEAKEKGGWVRGKTGLVFHVIQNDNLLIRSTCCQFFASLVEMHLKNAAVRFECLFQ